MLTIEKILFLKRISIFQGLSSKELRLISEVLKEEEYSEGEVIFREGELGDCMYFLYLGKVNIFVGEPPKIKVLATFESGDFFGEMGLYDDKPRAASAIAFTRSKMLVLNKSDFIELISDYPSVALGIMRELSQRLRNTNIKLLSYESNYIDKNSRLYNINYFMDCLNNEIIKAKNSNLEFCILVLTIQSDEKRSIENKVEILEKIIVSMSKIIILHHRPTDIAFRISERKIGVLLTNTPKSGAEAFLRRVKVDLEKEIINVKETLNLELNIKYSIICFPNDASESQKIISLLEIK